MLYRRFILVAALIAFFGVGLANLILLAKEQRDGMRGYPVLSISNSINCVPQRLCLRPLNSSNKFA